MHLEKLDDAFRRASWKKNQGLAFPCMLFRKGKPELQEAENECQTKQREMRDAITRLKRRSNSLSIKGKISDHALFQENPYQLS